MKNPNSKNGKSILFTCQNNKSLDILEKNGRFINRKEYIRQHFGDIAHTILRAYDWFVAAASKKIRKPDDVQYQIWCVPSSDVCMKPIENEVIYVLEVPDEEILYFNSFKWDYIINYHYVPENEDDLERYTKEMELKGFANTYEFLIGRYAGKFPLEEKRIRESWKRIFDISEWNTREIQANLWEIKKEWVKCIVNPGEAIPEEYCIG